MTEISQPGAPAAPPANAGEARIALDGKMADQAWGARLLSGDVTAKTEYRDLRAMIDASPEAAVARAMSGEEPQGIIQNSSDVELRGMVGHLREIGYNEQQVREISEGKEPSQADIDIARRFLAMRSQDFIKLLFSGDPHARLQNKTANYILSFVR